MPGGIIILRRFFWNISEGGIKMGKTLFLLAKEKRERNSMTEKSAKIN